jgi:hypothetical protein
MKDLCVKSYVEKIRTWYLRDESSGLSSYVNICIKMQNILLSSLII